MAAPTIEDQFGEEFEFKGRRYRKVPPDKEYYYSKIDRTWAPPRIKLVRISSGWVPLGLALAAWALVIGAGYVISLGV